MKISTLKTKMQNWLTPPVIRVLRALLIVLLLLPVLAALYRQWMQVRDILSRMEWTGLLSSLGVLMLSQPLMGLISWQILRGLNQFFSFIRISALYFVSQAAKYLPGGIWAFPGRVIAYQSEGVEKLASFISLVQEVGALFFGAAAVGAVGLGVGLRIPPWMSAAILAGIGLGAAGMLVAQLPVTFRLAARLKLVNPQLPELMEAQGYCLNYRMLPAAFLVSVVFWLLVGWGFRFLALAVAPGAVVMSVLQAAGLFSLAWCAGFVIVIAPSGIGVRETALAALLSGYMTPAEALSVALVARLWWMAGEFGFIGLALVWLSGRHKSHKN